MPFPDAVAELCAQLAAIDGVQAVTIGGSRGEGTADESSDWDLGVYYRGSIDLAPLGRHGEVHPPGSWGRIMNGGAWLTLDGHKVDVLLRDLDAVMYWTEQARRGVYEVDALLGYLAGAPTYLLMAELALNRTVSGRLPLVGEYPEPLSHAGARRWLVHSDFSLTHARMRAERGDVVGTMGQAAKAVMETAHAVACRRRQWIVNEKRLVERTNLMPLQVHFANIPNTPPALVVWIEELHATLSTSTRDYRPA
jgi:hypothetical protein